MIAHSYTLCQKDFHRSLISIFSFALFTQATSTVLFTSHQVVTTYAHQLSSITDLDFTSVYNIQYIAQLISVVSINFFILFLLIIAKGWPITRRDMPFKYAFAIFWLLCMAADLITFYWTAIIVIARNLTSDHNDSLSISISNITSTTTPSSLHSAAIDSTMATVITSAKIPTSFLDSLPKDTEQFNSTPMRLSLLLRLVIMVYFLLELRTTMILEQEQKKLQFYLHFGALSMVWFVHSVIVYVISLRVEAVWQSKLISGFSSAANFLAFAITTSLLWPKSSRSYLFRRRKHNSRRSTSAICEEAAAATLNSDSPDEDYDGLEMKVLGEAKDVNDKASDHNSDDQISDNLNRNKTHNIPSVKIEL